MNYGKYFSLRDVKEFIITVNYKDMWSRKTCLVWYQASAAKYMRTALFWVIMQRVVVIPYRCFGTTYRSHLQGSEILLIPQGFSIFEDGTDRLYRNVGKELPLVTA